MFKKGDLVKFASKNTFASGIPFYFIWYLVTKNSQDGWAEGVVVKVQSCSNYDMSLITSIGEIETFQDEDVQFENDTILIKL